MSYFCTGHHQITVIFMKSPISSIYASALLLLALTACSPLRIAMNSKSPEGIRTVLTSNLHLFGDFDVALGASIEPSDTVLGILVTCTRSSDHGLFDKGDRMKIRLSDGSVTELENIYHKEFDREVQTFNTVDRVSQYGMSYVYDPIYDAVWVSPVEVSRMVPSLHTTTVSNSYALYLISRPQLADIISKGVVNLRIEIEDDECDMKNTSGLSGQMSDMYDCLKEGIVNGVRRTKF